MAKENGDSHGCAIWVAVGITKNIGNYESLRLDAGARVEVQDHTDGKAWKDLWALVESQITEQLEEVDEEKQ